jgi:hypothetical protein
VFAIDNDNLTTGTRQITVSAATTPAVLSNGTYTVGTGAQALGGGLTVQPQGTVTLASSGGTLTIGATKTLTIDGTLNASSTGAIIQSAGGTGTSYTFKVGSSPAATPTLNITGLTVKNTDTNGMWIGADPGAVSTFTRFDNIAFSNGTGNSLLQIYSPSLYLASNGCTFDSGQAATTTYDVRLTGNGIADGETRAVFGRAICASDKASCQIYKQDDDSSSDGIGDNPATNAGVIQFVADVTTDTSGTLEGFPTAAFDWNSFAYYSTYASFHDPSATADRVYVRDATGAAKYSWDTPSGVDLIGTPIWDTVGAVHYVYVATTAGQVYRLIDNAVALSLTPDNTGSWAGANNPFDCGCTITTPLVLGATNLNWGGIATQQKIWTLGKATRSQPIGSPLTVTPTISSGAPALWTSGDSYLFLGMLNHVYKVDVTTQVGTVDNTNPTGNVGRIGLVSNRVFTGDDGGTFWALDPTNFANLAKLWSYHDNVNHPGCTSGICGIRSSYVDPATIGAMYGDQDGHLYALDATGAPLPGFPFAPGTSSDVISTAPLYLSGVIVAGTTSGKLLFIDRNNGSGPAVIRQYVFSPGTVVSTVAYAPNTNDYMVSTSNSVTKDGRVTYIDLVADPTPASQ